jgi:nucleoid DNA-binding protein
MKILAVAGNGALVKQGKEVELRALESFLTAEEKSRIVRNKKYEQTVYIGLRKRLEARVAR